MYKKYTKRIFDVIAALAALIILSPVFFIVAVLIRSNLGKPIIFKHQRPGKDEKLFTLYKFRSMTDERDEHGVLLPDEVRLTNFGRLLRATSLDELPELFNIIKGDMSIVGPRPLEVYFLPYYNEKEKHRHDVRPGLTGLAQVNGRNNLTWEQRFEYDLSYINQMSLLTDIKIIYQTIMQVIKREGTDIPLEDFNVHRKKQEEKEFVNDKRNRQRVLD
jgi:lipopolysaccharide/colanic/teichoic acid biosynthesis glycosyltransferase